VPKSSIARCTPNRLSVPSVASVASVLRMRTLSVISSVSCAPGNPDDWIACDTYSASDGSSSCLPDTFTVRPIGRPVDDSGHVAAVRQASSSTQRPSRTISPDASANGMNFAGETNPRVGWFQRSSASMLSIAPESTSTIG